MLLLLVPLCLSTLTPYVPHLRPAAGAGGHLEAHTLPGHPPRFLANAHDGASSHFGVRSSRGSLGKRAAAWLGVVLGLDKQLDYQRMRFYAHRVGNERRYIVNGALLGT